MGRLSARNQLYIGIALLVVVTVAVVFLVILPVYQQAANLNAQIATEKSNLATAQALLARRQSVKSQSAANEVELMRVANQVPDTPQLPSVIIEIQDIANVSELSLETITPQDMISVVDANGVDLGYSEVEMTLKLTGQWSEVIPFVRSLHSLDRGVRIKSVKITYIPEGEYLDTEVKMAVYVMAAATTNKGPVSQSAATTATVTPTTGK